MPTPIVTTHSTAPGHSAATPLACPGRCAAGSFVAFGRRLVADLQSQGRTRLASHYRTALDRFDRCMHAGRLTMRQITPALIQAYESALRSQGLCPNTTSYYMRTLRAIYHRAVRQGLATDCNPFRDVYTGIARTVKRAVSLGTIRALRRLDLRGDPLGALARDLFLFSFYTRGMAIVDVAFLRKSDLRGDQLVYRRRKTGQQLTIRWEPQMQQLVGRHSRPDSEYMFPLIDPSRPDPYGQYRLMYSRLLRRLKKIGEALGVVGPLTFHRSRHGWASIARDQNIPVAVISEAMGHDSERTTRIYLDSLDHSVVDRANSKIIRLLD